MIVVTSFTGNPRQIPSPGDLALAGSLLGVAVLSGFFIDASRPDTVEPSAWWHWALMATPPILVAFRRVAEARLRSENERTIAVAEERSHIARELHDVIGHPVGHRGAGRSRRQGGRAATGSGR